MNEQLDADQLKRIVEAALMAAAEPLSVNRMAGLFRPGELDRQEGRKQIRDILAALAEEAEGRGYELKQVATGYRFQVRQSLSPWVSRLWEEKPPRYSRALLETLALIVYRQPVTRADIESVRGVAVSQNILRTLLERGWIRVVGQRETPGRPNLYGATRGFLDYFNLQSFDDLPALEEIERKIEQELGQLAKPILNEETADASDGGLEAESGEGESEPSAAEAAALAEVVQLPTARD
ncbi:MAG: SMC-Scp complex subunit ScpB [Gammaproteobacteria bacterium]|nr:SMC-Scp complex subunit ScpB [Gammaproteobacteria bacterium]MYE51904.1 SMC-Scp complex subunit ScpB [Gammaproteobacteria bacterium]